MCNNATICIIHALLLVPHQSWVERQCRSPRRPFESIMDLLPWFHFILSYQICLKLFHKIHQTSIYPSEQLPASYHMLYLKYGPFCTYFPLYSALSYQLYFLNFFMRCAKQVSTHWNNSQPRTICYSWNMAILVLTSLCMPLCHTNYIFETFSWDAPNKYLSIGTTPSLVPYVIADIWPFLYLLP